MNHGEVGGPRLGVKRQCIHPGSVPKAPVSRELSAQLLFGGGSTADALLRDIRTFAATPYPVLLLGPTGSGKTVVARELHNLSPRFTGPYIRLPLPSIPDELRHAEFAGFRRGAFTGALEDRIGALEAAHAGTLFLDELGYASLPAQQMLLTALESGAVRRLGEVRERGVDVRFVCATTANLPALCREGRFLEELYYRIECLTIRLPSLAERRGDILPLSKRFIAEELGRLGKGFEATLSLAVVEVLLAAGWPGNVRQLKSVCRFIATRLDTDRIVDLGDLPASLTEGDSAPLCASSHTRAFEVLRRVDGNKAKAARILGITRSTLYRLLEADPGSQDGLRTNGIHRSDRWRSTPRTA